jgi:nitrate reductase NapE component
MSDKMLIIRGELLTEYYKLTDIIHKYDDYFLRIKAWGVTVSGAAAGVGVAQRSELTFFIAALLAIAFWFTEARHKVLQLDHMLRIGELEDALKLKEVPTEIQTPRIFGALSEQKKNHRKNKKWLSVLFWPHVIFPHIFFAIVGLVGGVVLIISS